MSCLGMPVVGASKKLIVFVGVLMTLHCFPLFGQLTLGSGGLGTFTNLADRFLQSQLNLTLDSIQVSPTNYYSPAMHRLLQVAANLSDCATNPPAVYRPLFSAPDSNGAVFISGYVQDNDPGTVPAWLASNPHGIPAIIVARKGLPNFNEYVMQTAVQVMRKLEARRRDTNSPPFQTNVMFLVSITNLFGAESWNS